MTSVPPSPFHDVDCYIAGSPHPTVARFLVNNAEFLGFVQSEQIVPRGNSGDWYEQMIASLRRLP